jgi:competence protein ComEC
MPKVHFLNVRDGDCNIIEHYSGHVTVIDVCNAAPVVMLKPSIQKMAADALRKSLPGDFGQKDFPVNPIEYLKERNFSDVFRFIMTHPDMDHMDGIKAFFKAFPPTNFWDTDNCESKKFGDGSNGGFSEDDWKFYLSLRDGKSESNPKR